MTWKKVLPLSWMRIGLLIVAGALVSRARGQERVRPAGQAEFRGRSAQELRLLRNEIFARHGKRFSSPDLTAYFSRQSWYKPRQDYSDNLLTTEERVRIQQIQGIENAVAHLNINLDAPPPYRYQAEILANLRIGAAPGEIGMKYGESNSLYAPESIAVDSKSHIYIDDCVNARVQHFDSQGRFQAVEFVYPPEFVRTQLSIDSRDHLYLTFWTGKMYEIWEVFRGKVLKKYRIDNPLIPATETLGDGHVWLYDSNAQSFLDLAGTNRVPLDFSAQGPSNWPGRGGRISIYRSAPTHLHVQSVPDREIIFTSSAPIKGRPYFSSKGTPFFQANTALYDFQRDRLVAIDSNIQPGVRSSLASNGDIYGLLADEVNGAGTETFFFRVLKAQAVPTR